MEALCLILYFVAPEIGLNAYAILFYPVAICLLIVFFYTIPELLRNVYLSSLLTLISAIVLTAVLIVSIFLQGFLLGTVYIVPFNFI